MNSPRDTHPEHGGTGRGHGQSCASSLLTFLTANICHPESIQGTNEMLYMLSALQTVKLWENIIFYKSGTLNQTTFQHLHFLKK